jgi:hypothetical protein
MSRTRERCLGLALGVTLALAPATAAEGWEEPSIQRVTDVLPPELLRSDVHTVAEEVRSDGFLHLYRVKSKWSDFEVWGTTLLGIRVSELQALAILEEKGGAGDAIKQGFGSLGGRVTRGGQKALNDPGKFFGDAISGTGKRFARMGNKLGKATKTTSRVASGAEGATAETRKQASRDLGLAKSERDLHKRLGTDPYTTNQALSNAVRAAAKSQALAKMYIDPISISDPEGLAMQDVRETLYAAPPETVRARIRKQLEALGAPEARVQRAMQAGAFNLTLKAFIAEDFHRLGDVTDVAALLAEAPVTSEDEAYFVAQTTGMLADHHEGHEKLARIVGDPAIFAAVTVSGKLVAFGATDQLLWTEPFAGDLKRLIEAEPASQREIWITGTASERCRREVEALGFTLNLR